MPCEAQQELISPDSPEEPGFVTSVQSSFLLRAFAACPELAEWASREKSSLLLISQTVKLLQVTMCPCAPSLAIMVAGTNW